MIDTRTFEEKFQEFMDVKIPAFLQDEYDVLKVEYIPMPDELEGQAFKIGVFAMPNKIEGIEKILPKGILCRGTLRPSALFNPEKEANLLLKIKQGIDLYLRSRLQQENQKGGNKV